jgi:hypothetical protein
MQQNVTEQGMRVRDAMDRVRDCDYKVPIRSTDRPDRPFSSEKTLKEPKKAYGGARTGAREPVITCHKPNVYLITEPYGTIF